CVRLCQGAKGDPEIELGQMTAIQMPDQIRSAEKQSIAKLMHKAIYAPRLMRSSCAGEPTLTELRYGRLGVMPVQAARVRGHKIRRFAYSPNTRRKIVSTCFK